MKKWKQNLVAAILLFAISQSSFSQKTNTINGIVSDGKMPIEFVDVVLKSVTDTTKTVAYAVTDASGKFTLENIHYNLIVRLLNDRFGIQVRGGWSCASTYAHFLLNIDEEKSTAITNGILQKNLTEKPGWVRVSLHPTMKNDELLFICNAVEQIVLNIQDCLFDYLYKLEQGYLPPIQSV